MLTTYRTNYITSLLIVLLSVTALAGDYKISPESLMRHIEVLASDSLEGREVGEIGEQKAAAYISGQFEKLGLKPMGDNGTWLQKLEFTKKIEIDRSCKLTLNGQEMKLHEDFVPMLQSASQKFSFDDIVFVNYGINVARDEYDDYKELDVAGKAVVLKRFAPKTGDSTDVRFDKYSSIEEKISLALEHEAAGIFIYTPASEDDTIFGRGMVGHITPKAVPVIWLRRTGLERLGLDLESLQLKSATGAVQLNRVRDTGYNVISMLPGESDTTVIVGAHYDHLGWGTSASLYKGKEKKIHYGADDNGSGVAAILEIAHKFANSDQKPHFSYMFACFTGEEAGLLGSTHMARNLPVDSSLIRMMLNVDMIGHLQEQEKGLAIFGTGTCSQFKMFFDSLDTGDLKVTAKEAGIGASDHTAFYSANIPVMHFFTGAHDVYHRPGDIPALIDSEGLLKVTSLIDSTLSYFDSYDSTLVFKRTKGGRPGRGRGSYSVTLGIMPDHVAEVKGMKIGDVMTDGVAEKAGLLKGDIIIKMGIRNIDDIYGYMNALGKYHKGDTTTVVVERGSDTVSVLAEFK